MLEVEGGGVRVGEGEGAGGGSEPSQPFVTKPHTVMRRPEPECRAN